MTLLPEEAARERIAEALAAHDPGQEERVNVPWKGGTVLCPVVRLQLDAAALNPHSHRIRSELESDPNAAEIRADPYSEESQERIAEILRETERYEELKKNLEQEGQRDHGVITNAGLLVNANTRKVALADLGRDYIKVAVLPGDAAEREISDLEVRLQMQRDFKQEYTFTNELLFVEDLRNNFAYSAAEVARILRRSEKDVEQFTRLLAMIRGIQHRSNGAIPLKFFDEDKEQILKDLDQAYEAMKERDESSALRMRDARILALLVGSKYRDVRFADENFVEDYLIDALQEQDATGEAVGAAIEASTSTNGGGEELPGVDELGEDPAPATAIAGLVDVVAKSFGQEQVAVPSGDGESHEVERGRLADTVANAFAEGAAEARTDQRHERGLTGPIDLLKDARKKLRKVLPAYRDVAKDANFDGGSFGYEARKLKADVDALHAEIEKQSKE
jgi:hypothetical protein